MEDPGVEVRPVPTGVPLEYLLPPTTRMETLGTCPAVICGPIPPSSTLHIAIGHNMSRQARQAFMGGNNSSLSSMRQEDAEIVDEGSSQPKYTWIVTSSRMHFHERLLDEDERFLRQHGGHPSVRDALSRTEIRYCTTPAEWLLLVHLLHGRQPVSQEFDEHGEFTSANADSMARQPTLVILHDLLGMVLEREEDGEQAGEDQPENPGDEKDDSARPSSIAKLEVYMQILAAFRSMVEQVSEGRPDTIILEPSLMDDGLKLTPATVSATREAGRISKVASAGLSVKASLQWIFGPDQVWDVRELESGGYEIGTGSGNAPVATWTKTTNDERESVYRWGK